MSGPLRVNSDGKRTVFLALVVLIAATACARVPVQRSGSSVAAQVRAAGSDIAGLRQPRPGLYTGGQPPAAAWNTIVAQGVRTVVNLRPDAEVGVRDEAAEVRAAGMAYRQIPVAGAADITVENASRLWALLAATSGPKLVHCSSGNRVGALLAIGAATQGGMDTEAAIAFGRSAGLGSAEGRVREVLTAPATKLESRQAPAQPR